MADQTINFGQIFAVAVVGFLIYRWFSSSSTAASPSSRGNAGRQVNPAHVEQVASMFPQLDRRTIMWDLQRNGGSVQATTERVLSGRSLDTPPPSFQPQIPRPATTVPSTNPVPPKPAHSDLITRYNLSNRIASPAGVAPAEQATTTGSKPQSWSQNKTERADILKKRREEMVLAARRKMEERDRSSAGAAAGAGAGTGAGTM
ncbi:hypothetical protein MBLNU459_g2494t2 [Dothideomycetes sp. NU459]